MRKVSLEYYQKKVPFNVVTCKSCRTSLELEYEEEISINPEDRSKAYIDCPSCDNTIKQSVNSVRILTFVISTKRRR